MPSLAESKVPVREPSDPGRAWLRKAPRQTRFDAGMVGMMRHIIVAPLMIMLILPMTTRAATSPTRGPVVAVELETMENTLDGCVACGCRVKEVLEPASEHDWWMTFGVVQSDGQGGWQAVVPSSHCASAATARCAGPAPRIRSCRAT